MNQEDFSSPLGDILYIMRKKEYIRKINKLGRNDKCYCNSNKKFKKCCLLKVGTILGIN